MAEEPRFKVPHTLVLLVGMILLAFVLTFLLPQGSFERQEIEGHERVVAGSYSQVADPVLLPWHAVLTAVPKGFTAAQGIIFFVFIIGGAFAVLRATGAVDAALASLLARLGHYPALLLIGAMAAFATGSATIGMAEEFLPFVPVMVALCLALGYDTVTAVGTLCIGYGVGYGAALINPFTVLIAQDIAEVQPSSGIPYRLVLLVVFLAIGFHHVWRYARKVKADPAASLVADQEVPEGLAPHDAEARLTGTHVAVLTALLAVLAVLIYGLIEWGWYLVEMSAIFVGATVLLAAIARMGPSRTAREFCKGAAELTTTALLIGFARAIQVVLDDGQIVDTIVYGIAQPLQQMGSGPAAVGMLAVQSLCNFFIPSGSGQAYVTMPLMAPIGDLVGVTRQVSVLAYQFGDGFTNILVPTNAVLVGILAIAGIPFDRWLRFILPFMLKIWLAAAIALVVAVAIGYS